MKNSNYGCSEILIAIIIAICLAIVGNLLLAGIALWMWGLVIVPVFGAPALTFWQMYGIMILISCLMPIRFDTKGWFKD
jgi:hypothetical protein